MRNKKAITASTIIKTILVLVALIFLINFYVSYSKAVELKSKQFECNQLFSSINADELFFSENLDSPTLFMSNSITELCPSVTAEVSEKSVRAAADLIRRCHFMTSSGEDILENTLLKEKAICLYCGEIKTEDTVNNFNELLSEELKDERYSSLFDNSEVINSNTILLDESTIPKTVSESQSISVFSYVYRPDYNKGIDTETGAFDPIGQAEFTLNYYREPVAEFIARFGAAPGTISDLFITPDIRSVGGIILSEQEPLDTNNFAEEKVKIQGPFDECILYVPQEHWG